MSTVALAGAEWGAFGNALEPGQSASPSLIFDSTVKRTGSYAFRSLTGGQAVWRWSSANARAFAQVYVRFDSFGAGGSVTRLASMINTGPSYVAQVRVNLDGTAELWAGDTLAKVGSSSAAMSTGVWYCIELGAQQNSAGAGTAYAELRIDGTSIASSSALTITTGPIEFEISGSLISGTTTPDVYFDDIVVNTNTDGVNDSWPNGQSVVLLRPVSDNTKNNWTDGAGSGTSNLWSSIDNRPPFYDVTANEGVLTNIECTSNTGTSTYIANLETYTNAGIAAADTVNAVCAMINHGEDISTGTKTGTFETTSNPVIASSSFDFGNNSGAHATIPTTTYGYVHRWSQAPSVTLGNNPAAKVVKTDTTTRKGCVMAMGMYVSYTPAPADRAPLPTYNRRVIQAVNRASVY